MKDRKIPEIPATTRFGVRPDSSRCGRCDAFLIVYPPGHQFEGFAHCPNIACNVNYTTLRVEDGDL